MVDSPQNAVTIMAATSSLPRAVCSKYHIDCRCRLGETGIQVDECTVNVDMFHRMTCKTSFRVFHLTFNHSVWVIPENGDYMCKHVAFVWPKPGATLLATGQYSSLQMRHFDNMGWNDFMQIPDEIFEQFITNKLVYKYIFFTSRYVLHVQPTGSITILTGHPEAEVNRMPIVLSKEAAQCLLEVRQYIHSDKMSPNHYFDMSYRFEGILALPKKS
jgi:hypothetical protein